MAQVEPVGSCGILWDPVGQLHCLDFLRLKTLF